MFIRNARISEIRYVPNVPLLKKTQIYLPLIEKNLLELRFVARRHVVGAWEVVRDDDARWHPQHTALIAHSSGVFPEVSVDKILPGNILSTGLKRTRERLKKKWRGRATALGNFDFVCLSSRPVERSRRRISSVSVVPVDSLVPGTILSTGTCKIAHRACVISTRMIFLN